MGMAIKFLVSKAVTGNYLLRAGEGSLQGREQDGENLLRTKTSLAFLGIPYEYCISLGKDGVILSGVQMRYQITWRHRWGSSSLFNSLFILPNQCRRRKSPLDSGMYLTPH